MLCFFDKELTSHTEMNKPYFPIFKVQVKIFAATAQLSNRSSGQHLRKICSKRLPESRFSDSDSTDRHSGKKRCETPAHRFNFWQFRHHPPLVRLAPSSMP